jgi:hypothetical protein
MAGLDPAIHAKLPFSGVAALFDARNFSMDHRVKPGGNEGENGAACSSLRAAAKQSSWLAQESGLLRRSRSSQ